MDIQSILVDSGIIALLVIQVLQLVNRWLSANRNSATITALESYLEDGSKVAQGTADVGFSILEAFSDGRIDKAEFDEGMSFVKNLIERRKPDPTP